MVSYKYFDVIIILSIKHNNGLSIESPLQYNYEWIVNYATY